MRSPLMVHAKTCTCSKRVKAEMLITGRNVHCLPACEEGRSLPTMAMRARACRASVGRHMPNGRGPRRRAGGQHCDDTDLVTNLVTVTSWTPESEEALTRRASYLVVARARNARHLYGGSGSSSGSSRRNTFGLALSRMHGRAAGRLGAGRT